MTYTNPIISGFHPDPSICRVGLDYFLVTSSFEYFPGVPLFHSRDLVHWRQIGHVLTRPAQLSFANWRPSGGIFAPTIRHHDGVFYMITTNMSGGGNFYVHTKDPFGEWSDPIWVEQSGIDPSLHFDDDGRVYLTSNWIGRFPPPAEVDAAESVWGIQQSKIDIKTGKLLTEPRPVWAGTGGRFPEAPHLYQINGRYYLLIAEGGTELGHMVTIARSDTPWGPWESCPHNPILTHRSWHSPIQAVGHADFIEAHDGSWWLVCLGTRPSNQLYGAHLGRETFLAPVQWDEAGWPHIGQDGKLMVEMKSPPFAPVPWEAEPERDDFDAPQLGVVWNFLGVPDPTTWSLTARPSALCLQGNGATLDDGPPVAFVGRRQVHHTCKIATRLDFEPATDKEEAGVAVWMNPTHHYDLFVTQRENKRQVVVRRRIGSLVADVAREPIGNAAVTLTIEADPQQYRFGFINGNNEQQILATGETRYLAPEVTGGFTGIYFALYASGGGQDGMAPAFFDWFDYRTAG